MSHSQVAWSPEPEENRRGAQLDLGAADPRRRSGARLAKRYHSFPGPPPSPGDERGASTAPAEFNTSWGSKGPATRKRQEILATLVRVPPVPYASHGDGRGAPRLSERHLTLLPVARGRARRRGWKLGVADPIPPGPRRRLWATVRSVQPSRTLRPASRSRQPLPTCGRGCAARGGRCAGSSAAPVRSGRGAAPASGRAALPGSSVPQLRVSRPLSRRSLSLPRAGGETRGREGRGVRGAGRGGGRGGGRAAGAGPGLRSPPSPGRGAAATPRQPRALFPRLLRRPFTPLPSFHSSSSLLVSPVSRFQFFALHFPSLPPFLSFSSLFSSPPHPLRSLPSPLSPLSLSPSFAFRLVASSLPWLVCLGLCVSVLFNMDFPLGFSLSSLAGLLLLVFFVSLSLFHPLLSL